MLKYLALQLIQICMLGSNLIQVPSNPNFLEHGLAVIELDELLLRFHLPDRYSFLGIYSLGSLLGLH
jgi:hypothetical protein